MPYVERVPKAGNTIEIERYFTSRYKKKNNLEFSYRKGLKCLCRGWYYG